MIIGRYKQLSWHRHLMHHLTGTSSCSHSTSFLPPYIYLLALALSFEQCCGQSAMETLPPPKTPPPSILEALEATWVRTPAEVIDSLISTCVIPGNFQKFNQDLDYFSGPGFAQKFMVIDLRPVMVEAIKRDSTPFVSELLRRGLPMCPYFATEAVCSKSENCLEVFLQQGWDINEPAGPLNPPVLW